MSNPLQLHRHSSPENTKSFNTNPSILNLSLRRLHRHSSTHLGAPGRHVLSVPLEPDETPILRKRLGACQESVDSTTSPNTQSMIHDSYNMPPASATDTMSSARSSISPAAMEEEEPRKKGQSSGPRRKTSKEKEEIANRKSRRPRRKAIRHPSKQGSTGPQTCQ